MARPHWRDALDVALELAGMPEVAPAVADLAEALGWSPGRLAAVLDIMEDRGRVERWKEATHTRVMLSMKEARRRGLILGRRPERWIVAAGSGAPG